VASLSLAWLNSGIAILLCHDGAMAHAPGVLLVAGIKAFITDKADVHQFHTFLHTIVPDVIAVHAAPPDGNQRLVSTHLPEYNGGLSVFQRL
jgi:hypothetical protein